MPSPTPAHRPAWRGWATMTEADKNGESLYPPMQSAEIRRVRQDSGLSQAGFARLLVTHKRTVQRWETGTMRPTGASLALRTLVRKRGIPNFDWYDLIRRSEEQPTELQSLMHK